MSDNIQGSKVATAAAAVIIKGRMNEWLKFYALFKMHNWQQQRVYMWEWIFVYALAPIFYALRIRF